jgi:hypothetical protein
MRIEQVVWSAGGGWNPSPPEELDPKAQLIVAFGARSALERDPGVDELRRLFPEAVIFGCSTAGEITGNRVLDDTLVITAIQFATTRLIQAGLRVSEVSDSVEAGVRLAEALPKDGLVHVLVLSDGLQVNGSELVQGLASGLPPGTSITGGLSGDGDRFESTLVLLDGRPTPGAVVCLGLYGEGLRVGYASLGGWDPFGPERLITRSEGNVLYELDGQSALELYKTYLGEHAKELPASGLLFPLSIRIAEGDIPLVRTILAVDEQAQTMTFAGNVPQGAYARLMKANFDRLIDGAANAARTSFESVGSTSPELAILISCVGRKMVLKQRVDEEVEGVREVVGNATTFAGFYSYGEISPFTPNAKCELHNQTMTITTLSERAA